MLGPIWQCILRAVSQAVPRRNRNTFLALWPDQQESGRWGGAPWLWSLEMCILTHVLTSCVTLLVSLALWILDSFWTEKGDKRGISKVPPSVYDLMIIKISFLLGFRLTRFLPQVHLTLLLASPLQLCLAWSRLNATAHRKSSHENVNSLAYLLSNLYFYLYTRLIIPLEIAKSLMTMIGSSWYPQYQRFPNVGWLTCNKLNAFKSHRELSNSYFQVQPQEFLVQRLREGPGNLYLSIWRVSSAEPGLRTCPQCDLY